MKRQPPNLVPLAPISQRATWAKKRFEWQCTKCDAALLTSEWPPQPNMEVTCPVCVSPMVSYQSDRGTKP